MKLSKKINEGKLEKIPSTEQTVIRVDNEIPDKLNKITKEDTQSFEDFKTLYKGVIDMKCQQDYGDIEDKDLWEDCAKELFLKSKTYLLKGDEYKANPLETKKQESKSINESIKDSDIERAIKRVLSKDNNIITDDSIYDIVEELTGIEDIEAMPQSLIDKVKKILSNKTSKKESFEIKPGDKFINENGAMITVLEPTNTGKLQFKVTNTINGKEGTNVYISNSLEKVLKDNGYTKIEERINNYDYIIYRPRLTKSPIYVKNYSTETEDKNEAITFPTKSEAEEYRDNLELSYKEQYKIGVKNLDENKEIKTESRDRVAENLPKFIYDLTKKDFDDFGETAWSAKEPARSKEGLVIYEVFKNGKSNYTSDYVVKEILKTFPELKLGTKSDVNALFTKFNKVEESTEREYIATYKMPNGTFFELYKNGNKLVDQNGNEISEAELNNYEKIEKKIETIDNKDSEYDYMMLGRLKSDCDYFLGNGNGDEAHSLWAKNIDEQISKMKELYNKVSEKPEWLTLEDIDNYEKAMKDLKASKEKKTESVVSDYTLTEIKRVIDSNGDDFNLKISNADIDVETKTLSIDREDLISIYNTLGGNKDSITESRPDKDRARAAAFAGSRRRLQLPANGLNEEAEIIEYLEKCKNQIDIMNVNEAIKNTELRNKLLTTGFDFAKSVNIVDDHIDEFKNVMIKATQDYFQTIKTESKEGYQDKCCMCGTSNLNGCYSVLDEEGNVGSVCVDCGKKYSLPEIEKKINSDMKFESKETLKEDQYEVERRRGRPNLNKIAKEIFEYDDYYIDIVDNYKDEWEFVKDHVAEVAAEYNLKEQAAEAVMRKVYSMATKKI